MSNNSVDERVPAVGMLVIAIDGYVGTVVSAQLNSLNIFTIFIESSKNFVDLNLYFVDRITQDHILLNVNKQSLNHLKI